MTAESRSGDQVSPCRGGHHAHVIDTRRRLLRRTCPPQLPQVPQCANLVTITAGGNDLHHLGSTVRLGYAELLSRHVLTRPIGALVARTGGPRVSAAPAGSIDSTGTVG